MNDLDENIGYIRILIEKITKMIFVLFQGSFWSILGIQNQFFDIESSKFYEISQKNVFDRKNNLLIENSISLFKNMNKPKKQWNKHQNTSKTPKSCQKTLVPVMYKVGHQRKRMKFDETS